MNSGGIRRRWRTMRTFAAAGEGWLDRLQLAAAGFARHRPFGGRGLYDRIGRLLCSRVTPRVRLAGGERMALDLTTLVDPMIFEEIYVEHTYPIERVPFQPDLVVDCGACTGMFSLLARAQFPDARVIALEPEPRNFARLRENIERDHLRIEAFPFAVGTANGRVQFAGEGFGGHVTTTAEAGAISVELRSLPELLAELRPARLVLKIDIEGGERELLPAILPVLPPQTVIFLETHHDEAECERYLQPCRDAGFHHERIRHRTEASQPSIYVERLLVRDAAPVRHYCTYFDRNYASLGLALYESLRRHSPAFCLWVLCLDDEVYALLQRLALPAVRLIALADFERNDAALRAARAGRSRTEYFFTCTPSLPLYVFGQDPSIDLVTYLDADLAFYASPERIFDEIGPASVAIIPHRFSPQLGHLEENGHFNVGWLTFRRDPDGLACLQWWRERCLEWCFVRHEPGRYADQKYLDDWPHRFRNVKVLAQKGANLAMWNLANYVVRVRRGRVLVDDEPLVFFHFHGLRRPRRWLFAMSSPFYGVRVTRAVAHHVFLPYVQALIRIEARESLRMEPGCRLMPEAPERDTTALSGRIRFALHLLFHLLRRNYIVNRGGRAVTGP